MTTRQTTEVRCRPDKSGWITVGIFGAIGLACVVTLFLPSHKPSETPLFRLMALMYLVPTAVFAAWLLRAQVVADANGLRWRMMGLWHTVTWDEVTDYYEVLVPGKPSKRRLVLETRQGRLSLSRDTWGKGIEAICTPIEQSAALAKTKQWELYGTRLQDEWPRVFRYDTFSNRWSPWLVMGCLLLCMASMTSSKWGRLLNDPGWVWNVLALGIVFLMFAPLFWLALYSLRTVRPRLSQRITATMEGLVYEERDTRIQASWAEVASYGAIAVMGSKAGIASTTYTITTQNGSITFNHAITDVFLLREIISRYARNAVGSEWRLPHDDVLGGTDARWTGGYEGVGERIYHYRTRTSRAFLWYPSALAGATGVLAALTPLGLAQMPWSPALVLTLLSCWGWWRYRTARIQLDGNGITQYTIFGPRHLRWDQIERFSTSGDETIKFGNVAGAGTRIRFWMGIADVETLKDEIARRATHSRNRTWDKAGTQAEPGTA